MPLLSKVVKPRARTRLGIDRKAWDVVLTFDFRDIPNDIPLTRAAIEKWGKSKKPPFYYVNFKGLRKTTILSILSAAKRKEVLLGIDRWGRIANYRLKP